MPTNIKIKTHVVKELPTERPLETGAVYKVEQSNGDLLTYTIDSSGNPVLERGITNDQNTRLERLSSEQISKVESIATEDIDKLKEDYTKAEIDQQLNNVRNLANSSRINLNGSTVLPVPPRRPDNTIIEDAWVRLAQNVTYTQAGGDPLTGIDGHETVAEWNNEDGEWVLVDMGDLPSTPTSDNVTPTGQLAVSEKGVYDYTKPLYDLTTESSNLSDNVFEAGAWNSTNGGPSNSASAKRLPSIIITEDLVGQHWINGRGILPTAYAYVAVRPTGNDSPPAVLIIPGRASNDDLEAITFNITSDMIGMYLRLSPGATTYEPSVGYENTFTWNMGTEPMPVFLPKGQLVIEGKNVDGVAFEVSNNEKVVRSKKVTQKTYTTIEGEPGEPGSGYFRYDTGALSASAARKIIVFPIVDPLLGYAISGQIDGASLIADVVYFDGEMGYLGYGERVQTGSVILDRKTLTLPSGTEFIGTGNFDESPQLVLESFVEGAADWDVGLFESDLKIEDEVITKIKGREIRSSYIAPIQGKTITKLGDSIMRAPSGQVGFIDQIASRNNMSVIDYSVGGATMTYNGNGTNDIVRQVDQCVSANLPTDYIIINGQTNDIISSRDIPIGVITEGYDATLDRETFTGAFEYNLKTLKTNFPTAKIVYVKVHKMDSRPFDRQESFGQRALEVCDKWAVPVADIYSNGQMVTYIQEHKDLYAPDGTHPNTLGYSKFYVPIVESLLNSI